MKYLNELGLEKNVDCVSPRKKFLMDSSARSSKHNRSRQRRPEHSHSFTDSLSVALCLLSVAKGRSLHGKNGTSVKSSRLPSPNSASV